MLTVKQTADMSGRTERTIWRMIAARKLPHRKDQDGRVWIREDDVPLKRADPAADATSALIAQIERLERRVAFLEGRSAPAVPVRPMRVLQSANVASGLPSSKRGIGRWVETHGGPREAAVRDRWTEISGWVSVGDALAGTRARGYQPQECDQAECGCHELLRA